MRTRQARVVVVAVFATATVAWPSPSSAQILDPCRAAASVSTPAPFGHEVTGSAAYTCTAEHRLVSVVGCLLLDGVPVDCDTVAETDSPSASVALSFPCLPGVWTVVAVGLGADRTLPATDVAEPDVVTQCDPLRP
jgi:hypothetical protein